MNELQIFNSPKFGDIRTVEINGKIHFVASDVSKALKYQNTSKAINDHCRWVTKCYIPHPQSKSASIEVNVIPEGDIYRLVANSQLPAAQEFESWIFDEVLPSIRKTGTYTVKPHPIKTDEPPKPAIFTYRGRRVVTIKDIARVTNKREGIIQSNIRGKKAKLKEGTDFSVLRGNDLREFKRENNIMMNYYSTLTVIQFSGFKKLCKLWGIIPDETGVFLPQKVPVSLPVTEKKADSALTTKLEKQLIQAKRAVDALNVALDVYSLPDHLFREGMKDALSLMAAHVAAKVTNLLRASDQLQLQPKV